MRLWKQGLDQARPLQAVWSSVIRTNTRLASTVMPAACASGMPAFHHQTYTNNNDRRQQLSVRWYSSTTPVPNKSEEEESMSFLERTKTQTLSTVMSPKAQFYALVAGGTIFAYGISRIALKFTSFFTHLTPTTIAKWGFYAGFGTAGVLGGIAAVVADNLYIRADPVYQYCKYKVINDTKVQGVLGDGIVTGNLRSYRLDAGRMELRAAVMDKLTTKDASSVGSPTWRPPRIQMIFDVRATGPPYRTGLVTCEATKVPGSFGLGKLQTTLLKVDYETGNEGEGGSTEGDQTLFLVGSEDDLTRVSRRSGLSLDMLARQVHINRAAAGEKV
ncbi:unnamed protein product [Cylindrotheca closterium]|uniref:Uncharacterized protein n=1 Tax=Cylindrotheca closterium TaxID=2856 RepID=A0AAD2G9Q1_9STRA|nr:unnamed protein product [Cylindrotheca closterium]